jgi:hypothetical protein
MAGASAGEGSEMVMTIAGMRAFRAAATLVDVMPMVRIRIRDGDRQLCTVSANETVPKGCLPSFPPCAFRIAVGQAHRLYRQGTQLRFLGMGADGEPTVDVGLRSGDVVMPGHIYRFRAQAGRFLFCFMTELGPLSAEHAVSEGVAADRCKGRLVGEDPAQTACQVGFHADPVTELTAVHTLCVAGGERAAASYMGRLLEICVAAEPIAGLDAIAPEVLP